MVAMGCNYILIIIIFRKLPVRTYNIRICTELERMLLRASKIRYKILYVVYIHTTKLNSLNALEKCAMVVY